MNIKETESYLVKEANSGNAIAKTYIALLKDCPDPIKEYWYQYLSNVLQIPLGKENDK